MTPSTSKLSLSLLSIKMATRIQEEIEGALAEAAFKPGYLDVRVCTLHHGDRLQVIVEAVHRGPDAGPPEPEAIRYVLG